ncbi:hypothetical protein J0H58_13480 [bacterium]|nr:hypothetical protein [bacterium]
MKRLPIVEHLSHAEIDRRYRTCANPAEKTRWHVLWLVTRPDEPLSATAVAKLVGFTPARGRAALKRYNAHGPAVRRGGRRSNGSDPKLTPEQKAERFTALQAEPPDGGLWSGPKVVAFVEDRFQVEAWSQARSRRHSVPYSANPLRRLARDEVVEVPDTREPREVTVRLD